MRTLVSLIRMEVLPLSSVLQCGCGLVDPLLHLITASKNSGVGCLLPTTLLFFLVVVVSKEGAGGA